MASIFSANMILAKSLKDRMERLYVSSQMGNEVNESSTQFEEFDKVSKSLLSLQKSAMRYRRNLRWQNDSERRMYGDEMAKQLLGFISLLDDLDEAMEETLKPRLKGGYDNWKRVEVERVQASVADAKREREDKIIQGREQTRLEETHRLRKSAEEAARRQLAADAEVELSEAVRRAKEANLADILFIRGTEHRVRSRLPFAGLSLAVNGSLAFALANGKDSVSCLRALEKLLGTDGFAAGCLREGNVEFRRDFGEKLYATRSLLVCFGYHMFSEYRGDEDWELLSLLLEKKPEARAGLLTRSNDAQWWDVWWVDDEADPEDSIEWMKQQQRRRDLLEWLVVLRRIVNSSGDDMTAALDELRCQQNILSLNLEQVLMNPDSFIHSDCSKISQAWLPLQSVDLN